MSDLDTDRELILDHSTHPRNFRTVEGADGSAVGHNPVCGDRVTVYLTFDAGRDRIVDAAFHGKGCAISLASASMMTQVVKGKTPAEAKVLFERFHAALTSETVIDPDAAGLDDLWALAGVRRFPLRVKCATLAWHTLRAALRDGDAAASAAVSTE